MNPNNVLEEYLWTHCPKLATLLYRCGVPADVVEDIEIALEIMLGSM